MLRRNLIRLDFPILLRFSQVERIADAMRGGILRRLTVATAFDLDDSESGLDDSDSGLDDSDSGLEDLRPKDVKLEDLFSDPNLEVVNVSDRLWRSSSSWM
jgi:hypothetical protein